MENPGDNLIVTCENAHVFIQSRGNALVYDPTSTNLEKPLSVIEKIAQHAGADSVLWQRLANDSMRESRFLVEVIDELPKDLNRFGTINHNRLDGVILTRSRQAVAFSTRDCPTLILYSERGGPIAVLHCSRSALQGADIGLFHHRYSVIENAIKTCLPLWRDASLVCGFITFGITPEHFQNDRYPAITKNIMKLWGPSVVPDRQRGTIDLVELIRVQLEQFGIGIKRERITHDGLDTYREVGIASKRRGCGNHHNLILVMHQ